MESRHRLEGIGNVYLPTEPEGDSAGIGGKPVGFSHSVIPSILPTIQRQSHIRISLASHSIHRLLLFTDFLRAKVAIIQFG